jgi:hypothetical protein
LEHGTPLHFWEKEKPSGWHGRYTLRRNWLPFPSVIGNLQFTANQISGVIVPQWIGQGKAHYLFPRNFEGGLVFYYGSYRDYPNPNLNGVLRTLNVYIERSR